MLVTLGNAAKQLGISKPTVSKAISRGHLSATKREDGSYGIDTSELMRWWEGARHRFQASNPPEPVSELHPSTPSDVSGNTPANTASTTDTANGADLEIQLARAEAQIDGLKQILEVERKRAEELRQERDRWASALEASQRQITDLTKRAEEKPKGFLGWFGRRA